MDIRLVGCNLNSEITTEGKSEGFINYYNRNVLNVHQYEKIIFHNVYPGIDWVIYSNKGTLKYDFVVKPGGNPLQIKMKCDYHDRINVNNSGGMEIGNSLGQISEDKPIGFQDNKVVETKFKLDRNEITFELGSYDRTKELVIDPAVKWATYFGGINDESGAAICADGSGNVYMAGTTDSNTDIAAAGHQTLLVSVPDAYLTKFDVNGNRIWATYYGGGGEEHGYACATDAQGNIYLVGDTKSSNNIASGGHQNTYSGLLSNAFIVKFNSNGVRLWATYYGDTNSETTGHGCSTDATGNIYLTGTTTSTNNISMSGFQNSIGGAEDAFIVKFSSSGTRLWASYFGGAGRELGLSCANDPSGNVYLAGQTRSSSNIASIGCHQSSYGGWDDAFLVKFDSSGLRLFSTYYGGNDEEWGNSCACDASGNVFLTGTTQSASNIAMNGFQNSISTSNFEAFLVKFNSSGIRLWATYYGGFGPEICWSCATDLAGDVYIAGQTSYTDDLATNWYQNVYGGLVDAFLVKFSSIGTRLWATYYGGTGGDFGFGCCTDKYSNVYLTGKSSSTNGIAYGNCHQTTIKGGTDAFLVKFDTYYTDVAIPKNQENNQLIIFPNPVKNKLTLNTQLCMSSDCVIEIKNSLSRSMFVCNSESTEIDVSILSPGIYFLTIRGQNNQKTIKFIKE